MGNLEKLLDIMCRNCTHDSVFQALLGLAIELLDGGNKVFLFYLKKLFKIWYCRGFKKDSILTSWRIIKVKHSSLGFMALWVKKLRVSKRRNL